jgi:phage gp29-like protein
MKRISVFILWAATAFAADFVTGQAARLVIGQTTFTAADPNSSSTVLGAASGVAYAGNTLFVADSNRLAATPSNDRVLVYSNLSSMLPQPTDLLVDKAASARFAWDRRPPFWANRIS